ncbi:MAG TPA: sulfatase [Candidatus Dormibacteraeota bacterium]|nr:sulfatase [Candidatus Dormibacteraeota bacterium]
MRDDIMNVLLVVLEGARADHLGCYGYGRETTPFLDQVARQGVRCTAAYTTAPSMLPAMASLLTGLFAHAHGATEESGALPPGPPLLPELLRGAGYRTAAFCPSPAVSPENGLGRGFERFYLGRGQGRITGRAADYARRASDRVLGRGDAGARRTTQALLEWLGDADEPFAALVVYREPASALPPPAPYDRMFAEGEVDARAAWHDGALRYVDLRLREVADALSAAGRWDHTLVVVTATHGQPLDASANGDPGFSPAGLHVPLLLRAPGRVPRGFVVDEIAQLTDVAPTILSLARVAAPDAPMQGRALLRDGAATPGPSFAFAEAFRREPGDLRRKAIRGGRAQFVWRSDEANAFYDVARDGEVGPDRLAGEVTRADALRRALFEWLASSERWTRDHGLGSSRGVARDGARDASAE